MLIHSVMCQETSRQIFLCSLRFVCYYPLFASRNFKGIFFKHIFKNSC